MKDKIGVHGSFTGTLIREDGRAEVYRKDNMILDSGIDLICNALASASQPAACTYIAVGTGTTAVAAGQTALVSEKLRKKCNYTHAKGSNYFTAEVTFYAGEATGALTEAGICNAASGGSFFDRVTFPVINKGANDVYTLSFRITFTRA